MNGHGLGLFDFQAVPCSDSPIPPVVMRHSFSVELLKGLNRFSSTYSMFLIKLEFDKIGMFAHPTPQKLSNETSFNNKSLVVV